MMIFTSSWGLQYHQQLGGLQYQLTVIFLNCMNKRLLLYLCTTTTNNTTTIRRKITRMATEIEDSHLVICAERKSVPVDGEENAL